MALVSDGRYEEAIVSYDEALKLDPQDFNILVSKGVALAMMDKHSEAIECFDRAISIDEDNKFAQVQRGRSLAKMGMHAEAVNSYNRALALGHKDLEVLEAKKESLIFLEGPRR